MQKKIAQYRAGKLQLLPGCDEEQSLEHAVMGVLNRVRNTASDVRPPTQCPKVSILWPTPLPAFEANDLLL